MPKKLLHISTSLFILLNISACGVVDAVYMEPASNTPVELFDSATLAMDQKQYTQATELYEQLQNDYPFSPYALEAELGLGDSLFMKEEFLEAADAYKAFVDLHPRNEAVPYALYQTGMSLLKSNQSVDKTATEASEAIQYFQRVISAFPGTVYAEQAPQAIVLARTVLAERELYTAQVYWNMGNSRAAYKRFSYVAETFPDLPEVKAYAESRAKEAFIQQTADLSEQERREQHGSWKDYFEWL